jgi:hypothetical protein
MTAQPLDAMLKTAIPSASTVPVVTGSEVISVLNEVIAAVGSLYVLIDLELRSASPNELLVRGCDYLLTIGSRGLIQRSKEFWLASANIHVPTLLFAQAAELRQSKACSSFGRLSDRLFPSHKLEYKPESRCITPGNKSGNSFGRVDTALLALSSYETTKPWCAR